MGRRDVSGMGELAGNISMPRAVTSHTLTIHTLTIHTLTIHTLTIHTLTMNRSPAGEEMKPDREDALERYGSFCRRVWSDGGVRVCEDTRLMEEAERAVFTQGGETHTFTLLPFYTIVKQLVHNNINTVTTTDNNEIYTITTVNNTTVTTVNNITVTTDPENHLIHTDINTTNNNNINTNNNTSNTTANTVTPPSPSILLRRLTKAFEILELLCINLLLYPWKKEFRTLRKFTAHFVYHIKAVLPPQATGHVLQHIGYESETHAEYRLSRGADPNRATEMGFELLLARLECEGLIQRMSQKSEAECLEIIHSLGSVEKEPELHAAPNGALEEDGTRTQNFLFHQEICRSRPDPEQSERESPKHRAFLSEDTSILEMQKDYPDLAFRQRPIFRSSSSKLKLSAGRDVKFCRETSAARSVTLQTPEPPSIEQQQLSAEASAQTPVFSHTADAAVTDLAEMMDKLKLKEFPGDESLKCPVEETNETVPILCSPSHPAVCSASDPLHHQHRDITEPPQSFYIPNRRNGAAAAPPAGLQENLSKAETEPDVHNTLEIL